MPFGGALTVGLIGAGTNIFSGLLGKSAASKAAEQQRKAALEAQAIADANKTKALGTAETNLAAANKGLDPYATAGATAQGQLGTALQNPFQFNIQDDPGYAFRMQQGQRALEGSAAARGAAFGGGALKALTQYGQGFASNEYQNAFQRHQQQLGNLFQQAGIGLNAATTQSGNYGQNSNLTADILGQNSNLASQNLTGAGNAQAAGTIHGANALSGAAGGLNNTAQQMFLYNLLRPKAEPKGPNFNPGSGPGYGYGPPTPPGYSAGPDYGAFE